MTCVFILLACPVRNKIEYWHCNCVAWGDLRPSPAAAVQRKIPSGQVRAVVEDGGR
jgi:hypothetical protein